VTVGSGVTLIGLTANHNRNGLNIDCNCHGIARDSDFSYNDQRGVSLSWEGQWTVENSTVGHNGGTGIYAGPLIYNLTLRDNRVSDNLVDGIRLQNQDDGATISGNEVSRNGGDGIHVDTSDSHITDNTTRGNGGTGIWVRESVDTSFGPAYLIADNISQGNGEYGIRACIDPNFSPQCLPGMIDGGGNVAGGNQLTPQCINIICLDAVPPPQPTLTRASR